MLLGFAGALRRSELVAARRRAEVSAIVAAKRQSLDPLSARGADRVQTRGASAFAADAPDAQPAHRWRDQQFETNRYSVPSRWSLRDAVVEVFDERLRIIVGDECVISVALDAIRRCSMCDTP